MTEILNLDKDYIVFDGEGKHQHWKADDFWKAAFSEKHPAFRKDMGSLVSRYAFSEDWNSWDLFITFVYGTEHRPA